MNKKYLLILLVPVVMMPMLLTGILSDDMSRADEVGRQFAADNPDKWEQQHIAPSVTPDKLRLNMMLVV